SNRMVAVATLLRGLLRAAGLDEREHRATRRIRPDTVRCRRAPGTVAQTPLPGDVAMIVQARAQDTRTWPHGERLRGPSWRGRRQRVRLRGLPKRLGRDNARRRGGSEVKQHSGNAGRRQHERSLGGPSARIDPVRRETAVRGRSDLLRGPAYNPVVDRAFQRADPRRRRILGVLVMAGIALLQLASEFLGAHDVVRFLSRSVALLVGLPRLVVGAYGVFRWATRNRFGLVASLSVAAVASGAFFALLLRATRALTMAIVSLPPNYEPFGEGDVLRVGFTMGLTFFALWAPVFVLPVVVEDARVRALEADKLRTQ